MATPFEHWADFVRQRKLVVQVVCGLADCPEAKYEEEKQKMKAKLKGAGWRSPYPIWVWRFFKEDHDDIETKGHLIGDGRLPDLRAKPPKSLQDFRELLARLIFVTCTGLEPPEWTPDEAPAIVARCYPSAKLPVWWPDDVEFMDPVKMKGTAVRRDLQEAVVRCYHLFNQLECLTSDLREFASEAVPRVAPGELPMSVKMMKSFHTLYMQESPHGIDD